MELITRCTINVKPVDSGTITLFSVEIIHEFCQRITLSFFYTIIVLISPNFFHYIFIEKDLLRVVRNNP